MRVIGQVSGAKQAYLFTAFLSYQKIEATAEKHPKNGETGEVFDIWVIDENQVDKAKEWLTQFSANPDDDQFSVPEEVEKKPESVSLSPLSIVPDQNPPKIIPTQRFAQGKMTRFIVAFCIALFAWMFFQSSSVKAPQSEAAFFASQPIFRALAYDIPKKVLLKLAFFRQYDIASSADVANLSPQEQDAYRQIEAMPTWNGLYALILKWPDSKKELSAPLFGQIAKGQVWRLVTPILLHGGFIHILFNMLWLWVLGKQLEERLKTWQYLSMTLIIAVVSNTAQYLVSGPLFLGYSGVLCGMVGFIWVRQRVAPWEGYPLHPITIAFLAIFILGLLALQLVSFFFAFFGKAPLAIGMFANSAHISGAICGLVLGRISFFSKGTV
ncbi:MAG: rhomboid family intramembrane serine protease [Chlamydiota bacterium]